jgi:hypothetical protein
MAMIGGLTAKAFDKKSLLPGSKYTTSDLVSQ